jgi:NAD(P)-dependent dehydrogenase (short-subunit alcohol dehydrogenase family)
MHNDEGGPVSATKDGFAGKVVLVTGGGTGIGRAIAEAFLAQGAKVAVSGRRREPLERVGARGQTVLPVVADVTKAADRNRLVETTVKELGRLDVLINNAGTFLAKPLAETTDEEIANVFSVNTLSVFSLTREALPKLIATKGNVVNVSSVVGSAVFQGTAAYSASKAALDHFTRLLAAEIGGQGVRVNAISPGVTETDMSAPLLADTEQKKAMAAQTPLGRIGTPEDIAKAVLFLAGNEAGWVTGQVVQASGGLML